MITFVTEKAGRSATVGQDSSRIYIFESSDGLDTEYDVYRHSKCPKIGSQHPNSKFKFYFIKRGNLKIRDSAGGYFWTVEAKFTPIKPSAPKPEEEQDFTNPTEEDEETQNNEPDFSPHVTLDFEDYPIPFEFARKADGTKYPVVNSALEKISNAEINTQTAVIRVTRNILLKDSLWKNALSLGNTVNYDRFDYRLGPTKLAILPYESRLKIRFGEELVYLDKKRKFQSYAQMECQFSIRGETWRQQLLDVGSVELSVSGKTIQQRIADDDWALASGTKQEPIEDLNNNKVLGLLDGQGKKLAVGANAVFNTYDGYPTAAHRDFYNRLTRR